MQQENSCYGSSAGDEVSSELKCSPDGTEDKMEDTVGERSVLLCLS